MTDDLLAVERDLADRRVAHGAIGQHARDRRISRAGRRPSSGRAAEPAATPLIISADMREPPQASAVSHPLTSHIETTAPACGQSLPPQNIT